MTQTDLVYTPSKEGFSAQCDRDLAQKRARLFTLQTAVLSPPDPLYEDFQPQRDEFERSQSGPVVGRGFKAVDRGLVVAQRQAKIGRCNHKPWVHPTISDAACLGHRVE